MASVYVSIGSNIDPQTHICACVQRLRADFQRVVFSTVYASPAEGFEGNPFLNLVAGFETALEPDALRAYLRELEAQQGRKRGQEKFSSRTLDLDLLLYDALNLLPATNLPHSDILHYAFVLYPLAEIAPNVLHPSLHCTLAQLARDSTLSHAMLTPTLLPCLPV